MTSGTGTCSVIANQAGSTNYAAAPTITQTTSATHATTSIAVSSVSPNSEAYGQDSPALITAVLSWSGSGSTPTASNVTIGGNGPGSYGVTSCAPPSGTTMSCTATYTPTTDAPGSYTESASFSGDTNYSSSASTQSGNFSIASATSSTSVGTSGTPSAYGSQVTFTATVSGQYGLLKGRKAHVKSNVSGSVTWSSNTGCSSSTVSGNPGTATCTTSSLAVGNDAVTATYSGDAQHGGSSGTLSGGQTVNQSTTSISVSSVNPSSEGYGQDSPALITAVLSWSGSGAAPTASDVAIGGNGPGSYSTTSCAPPSGTTMSCTATYTPTTDTTGSYTESASFAGDTNYTSSSSSQSNNFSIGQANSNTAVASSQNPSAIGQSVTFTATVSGQYGLLKGRNGRVKSNVSGSVTWSANTGCSVSTVSGNPGIATCTTSSLPLGTDTITATYSGDSYHNGSTGTLSGGQVVAASATTISVSSVSPATEAYGQDTPATITAVLSWMGNGPAPTAGNVTIGGNGPGSYSVTSCMPPSGTTMSCTATYTPTTDMPGSYTESAAFSGDSNYAGSNSSQTNNFAIGQSTSSTSVSTGGTPSTYGQPVTFTATVSGQYGLLKGRNGRVKSNVSGSVTWSANTGCSASTVSGYPGTATCTTSSLTAGNDAVTATYAGDADHSGSSGTLSGGQTVNQAAAAISVTGVSPASEAYGQDAPVTITAVLSWTGNGSAPTANAVSINGNGTGSYGATSCGAANGSTITCTAIYTPSTDAPGSYTESASFAGDSNYTGATSAQSGNFSIGSATSSTTVSTSGTPSSYGSPVTFTATVSGQYGLLKGRNGRVKSNVSGSVTWSANTGCSPSTVTGNPGTATCTTSSLAVGTDAITATYSGDSGHSGSSATLSGGEVVTKAAPTVSFSGLTSPAPYNNTYTLTATTNSSSTAVITGSTPTVCSLSGTTLTILASSGTCKVTATWAADANYNSATLTQIATAAKGVTVITWPTPAPIPYGTALGATQLDATATPAGGTFTYSPAAGKVEVVGSYTLKTTYKPSNIKYATATDSVTLQVTQAATTTTVTSLDQIVTLGTGGTAVKVTVAFNVGAYKPTGTVTLLASTGETCTGTVSSTTGSGSCKLNFTTTGTRSIAATYNGDTNHVGSNNSSQNPAVTVTVNPH